MKYAFYDCELGYILLKEEFFEEKKEKILSKFKNIIVHPSKNGFITLQTTKKLYSKMTMSAYINGELKQDSSCSFCKHRLQCITNNWICKGYQPVEKLVITEEEIKEVLDEIGLKLLYTKVV